MDYSDRVNAKKGGGGVADAQETDVHRKRRVKELLAESILDLDADPYVFRNHLGLLECKLCLTTHNNETSYLAHIGGKKHQLNLERRRLLDEKTNKVEVPKNLVTITSVPKVKWDKIGTPEYRITKIRDPKTYQLGLLIRVKYPEAQEEPMFRVQNYYELSAKNRNVVVSYHDKYHKTQNQTSVSAEDDTKNLQYLVISCKPYENICVIIPGEEAIDADTLDPAVSEPSNGFWWFWDSDNKDYYLQLLYK